MALSASHWPQVSVSVMLIWERMISTMPVTSSSGISVPLTVAATPPVAEAPPAQAARLHTHVAANPATHTAFMMLAVFIEPFPRTCRLPQLPCMM